MTNDPIESALDTPEIAVTDLLHAARDGDAAAHDALLRVVYNDLHARAHRQRSRIGADDTLCTTALVNEAYLRLMNGGACDWRDSNHFFAMAAKVMRGIVIDYARAHLAQKRGGGLRVHTLDHEPLGLEGPAEELVGLDAALTQLERLSNRLSQVVELRFFAGLSVEQTADILGVTPRTIKRDWRTARAFLFQAVSGASGADA